jgi:hypothetical protein
MMEHLVRVYNEKDRQTLEWRRRHVGDVAIASAVAQCGGELDFFAIFRLETSKRGRALPCAPI